MRLDKFLKVSRIFKRRTVAQEVAKSSKIFVNGRPAKPASQVAPGDEITIAFAQKRWTIVVVSTEASIHKEDAASMYQVKEEAAV